MGLISRRVVPILRLATIAAVAGCGLGATRSDQAESPLDRLLADDRFDCTNRPTQGDTNRSGLDRTEFGCAFDGQPWVLYAYSVADRQEYWVAPEVHDRSRLVEALGENLRWPHDLTEAIVRSDANGSVADHRWQFGADGELIISIADSDRVT